MKDRQYELFYLNTTDVYLTGLISGPGIKHRVFDGGVGQRIGSHARVAENIAQYVPGIHASFFLDSFCLFPQVATAARYQNIIGSVNPAVFRDRALALCSLFGDSFLYFYNFVCRYSVS